VIQDFFVDPAVPRDVRLDWAAREQQDASYVPRTCSRGTLTSSGPALAPNDIFNLIAETGTAPNVSFGTLQRIHSHGDFDRVGESFSWGIIQKGLIMRRICGLTAMALLISSCLSSAAMAASVLLILLRSDDYLHPSASFQASFDVDLSDVTEVTGVTVTIGSTPYLLGNFDGGGLWTNDGDIVFADLTAMQTALDGEWTIDVEGASPSTSTFTLTTTSLVEADFYPTASDLSPANGATGVPADTAISWTDPTGPSTPYALHLGVGSDEGGLWQEALSLIPGEISLTATTWQPPSAISAGLTESEVTYVDVDPTLVTIPLAVTSGSIIWSDSDLAPSGYPAATPLILMGSETLVQFTVLPEPSGAVTAGPALGTLLLLARLRRRRRLLA
jgi:hypothetical protein